MTLVQIRPGSPRTEGRVVDKRQHLDSSLAGESLVKKDVLRSTDGRAHPVLPELWLVLVGGSLFDRGKQVLVPLAERVGALRTRHQIALCAGGGVRERHTYKIGIDLGLPIGGLAMIAGAIPEQNALMLWALMSRLGAVRLAKEQLELIPFALAMAQVPILVAQPPYHYWEFPRDDGALPMHGADCGTVLLAENLGCRCVLLKDVDGIYDADPAVEAAARLKPIIRVQDLIDSGPKTLPVERSVLDILRHTRSLTRVHVASGLDPDNLDRILAGEPVGTILEGSRA
jgi:molybdenum storage protein